MAYALAPLVRKINKNFKSDVQTFKMVFKSIPTQTKSTSAAIIFKIIYNLRNKF